MKSKEPQTDKSLNAEDSPDVESGIPPIDEEGDTHGQVEIPSTLTVKQLADTLNVSAVDVIKQLMRDGVMATVNQVLDYETAAIIASDFGYEAMKEAKAAEETSSKDTLSVEEEEEKEDPSALKARPPVVTILGHVDHGKTTLLDRIRQSNILATEKGGITQHIGAYQAEVDGQKITFLDTPGHEAFTAMRARGAKVTDIAVIVVAADDGVMPQTVEAIDHVRAAGVPMIVAINKIDKADANVEKVKQQLANQSVLIEEWGGDVISAPISALTDEGIPGLLESILLVAEVADLKANPHRTAIGVVIEAKLDTNKGSLATILLQTGTLKIGDSFVVGDTWGKVKAIYTDKGERVKQAGPSMPVEVMGSNSVPQAGDILKVVSDERTARRLAEELQRKREMEAQQPARPWSIEQVMAEIRTGEVKELNIILKTDVQGSIEPLKGSMELLNTEEAKVNVIHAGSGSVTESDVLLAMASRGIIIGFNTRTEPGALRFAESEGVEIHTYDVIYGLVEDVKKALKGILEPTYADVIEGRAQVRAIFSVRKSGKVAGVYVTEGKITRNSLVRILRNGESIHQSKVSSLRHLKDDVRELAAGFEGGIGIEGYSDFQEEDIIEAYRRETSNE
ncbi:MAG: translation initiation factor IF-2 [Dehalococcoidia bacterium]